MTTTELKAMTLKECGGRDDENDEWVRLGATEEDDKNENDEKDDDDANQREKRAFETKTKTLKRMMMTTLKRMMITTVVSM